MFSGIDTNPDRPSTSPPTPRTPPSARRRWKVGDGLASLYPDNRQTRSFHFLSFARCPGTIVTGPTARREGGSWLAQVVGAGGVLDRLRLTRDANNSARLASDPIHKLQLDRDPVEGRDLASRPTLLRFENGVGVKELNRTGEALAVSVIRRNRKRWRRRALHSR
jgi:hypothetical protein